MNIYLMQHGLALSEAEDPNRPLSPEGKEGIEAGARGIKNLGLAFDVLICSRKARAQETAEIVAAAIGYASGKIVMTTSVSPSADAEKILDLVEKYSDKESVLIVGHLPSLGQFAGRLLTGQAKTCIRFQNGGLVRIDTDHNALESGVLRFCMEPEHLARIA